MVTRRGFLKNGGLALITIGLSSGVPAFAAQMALAEKKKKLYAQNNVLVCIFQRGAMDGLMAITPFTDQRLQQARPNLFIGATKAQPGTEPLIDLDGRFGMHPMLRSFEPLFREGRLAIVHGIGSPNNTRSHFDAQDYMESGTPFNKGTSSGWLNRTAGLLPHDHDTPFKAVSLTSALPRSFYGDFPCLAIENLSDFAVQASGHADIASRASASFEELYDQTTPGLLNQAGRDSFSALKMLQPSQIKNYQPANGAVYPNTALGRSLQQIAQLIKMNVGVEVAFAEHGGWDTHYNQGASKGIFAGQAADLSNSITALWSDLGTLQDRVTIMTMTEFGRTVHENGTGGTDHGRASCNFILGNQVNGGKVHGSLPELAIENLEDGRDLPVTTDFRTVFNEVAANFLNVHHQEILFPGWSGSPIGVMQSR